MRGFVGNMRFPWDTANIVLVGTLSLRPARAYMLNSWYQRIFALWATQRVRAVLTGRLFLVGSVLGAAARRRGISKLKSQI